MEGYTLEEQPKTEELIKLNTTETPYPPAPASGAIMNCLLNDAMRLYPAPVADQLRKAMIKVKETRNHLSLELMALGFKVIPSQANFILTSPHDKNGEALFKFLRQRNVLVRYFPAEKTKQYIRITIGMEEDMELLITLCKEYTTHHRVK